MQLERLLSDATQLPTGTSQHQQHIRLALMLNKAYGDGSISIKGVEKWFTRRSIPAAWLMRIAALPAQSGEPALNLNNYA